jgi:hypothetical protein
VLCADVPCELYTQHCSGEDLGTYLFPIQFRVPLPNDARYVSKLFPSGAGLLHRVGSKHCGLGKISVSMFTNTVCWLSGVCKFS